MRGCGSCASGSAALRHATESARPPVRYCRPGARSACRSHGRWPEWRRPARWWRASAAARSGRDICRAILPDAARSRPVLAEPVWPRRRFQPVEYLAHVRSSALRRGAAVVDRFAQAGFGNGRSPRCGGASLSSSRSMANRLAAASLQIAARAEIERRVRRRAEAQQHFAGFGLARVQPQGGAGRIMAFQLAGRADAVVRLSPAVRRQLRSPRARSRRGAAARACRRQSRSRWIPVPAARHRHPE